MASCQLAGSMSSDKFDCCKVSYHVFLFDETLLKRGINFMASPTEIGNFLANLRERSGKKQANLARQLEWSGALLSRIESGERPAVQDEIETILRGIGTEEAVEALNDLSRVWTILPEPPLGDTDRDLLWEAEEVALQVDELAERPDVKQFFERRLVRYREELEAAAANVRNKRYRVALMGANRPANGGSPTGGRRSYNL